MSATRWIEERATWWARMRSVWTMWRLRHVRVERHIEPGIRISRKLLEDE